jgi:hypothetical protein
MSETKVILTGVRFAYAHVFKAYAMEQGDEEKYSVTVIIPKDDYKNLDKVEDAIYAAIEAGKGKLGKGKFKTPLHDGDEKKPDDENFANCFYFNASTKRKPQVVDENLDPILDADEFYSGCYGNVSVNFYAYDNRSKGIAAGLNNIQKTEDGERLAGGTTAAQDFADLPGAKRSKRRRDEDDEEEERPRRRSRRDEDDEEEERPRRRSRRDEDDEEEERPRRRR